MKLNGAEILIRSLIDHDVDTVFGYPGGQVLDIYDALYARRDKIRHVTTAHEQGACHAADGYARTTGKVGVVLATSGPGATNLVTGIAAAFLDSVPLVAITGNVTQKLMGKDAFQEVDIAGITMPITKYNYIVKDINELETIMDEAFTIAISGRPGPVLIDIPKDVQRAKCTYIGNTSLVRTKAYTEYDKVESIAEIISRSKRPCLYIGGGVVASDAGDKVLRFADKIDAPIISSMMGLGAIRSDNERFLGMAGMHGTYAANKILKESDLLIAIGSRFSDRAIGDKSDYNNKSIIHIDIDPAEIDKNVRSTYHLIGDVSEVIDLLAMHLEKIERTLWSSHVSDVKASPENDNSMAGEYNPERIIKAVKARMNDDDIVATDVGQHQMWTMQYYGFDAPRTLVTSGGLGAMGYGLGAAIGALIGTHKRTVLFTSDGSFHMNMNELATVSTEGLPIVVVVFDNKALGMVKQWQHLFYKDRFSESHTNRHTNYALLAEAMGLSGYNVSNMAELETALDSAFSSDRGSVIACSINSDEMVYPMIPPLAAMDKIILRSK